MVRLELAAGGIALCLGGWSCLPGDTRPPPATLLVNAVSVAPNVAQAPAWSTEDGWTLVYDRFLVSVGDARPTGRDCEDYSDSTYGRILDMQLPGAQKVSLVHALGRCQLLFSLMGAAPDSVLGQGVAQRDRDLMGTRAPSSFGPPVTSSVLLQGSAFRDDVRKSFSWLIRAHFTYFDCADGQGGSRWLTLREGQFVTIDLPVHGEAVFHDHLDPVQAKVRFDAIADADSRFGDDDGEVTLDELALVPLVDLQVMNRYREAPGGPSRWKTLAEFVTRGALPTILGLGHLQCSLMTGPEAGL